jgi:hypothetical protein
MIDFRQDTNGDIDLTGGDIHYVESTVAHQRDLLLTGIGELKHSPLSGAGVHDFINDEDPAEMLRTVRRKFIADGMTVNSVKIDLNGQLVVDAYYDVYPVVPHFAAAEASGLPLMFPIILTKASNEFPAEIPFVLAKDRYNFPVEIPAQLP